MLRTPLSTHNRRKRKGVYAIKFLLCRPSSIIIGLDVRLCLQFGVYCIVTKMSLFTGTWLLLLIAMTTNCFHLEDWELKFCGFRVYRLEKAGQPYLVW